MGIINFFQFLKQVLDEKVIAKSTRHIKHDEPVDSFEFVYIDVNNIIYPTGII